MATLSRCKAVDVLERHGFGRISPDWSGCDATWNALGAMAKEGAVVLIKIDGERIHPADRGKYTVLISGGPLGDDYFRKDTDILEEGLSEAIVYYAEKCW
jgi:hypothetical protein